ncbi:MAG: twin-arginine translocase subunit TatC [Desulfomonilaceae bacterium]
MSEDESRMSFLDHLEELRTRLIRSVIAIVVAFFACLAFSENLFSFWAAPIIRLLPKDSSLVFTSLPDPFFVYLKVDFVTAFFLVLPFILYQIWLFIAPGLLEKERKLAIPFVLAATFLFFLGATFAYLIVFPAAFKFFLGYSTPELKPMIAIKEYVSLVMMLMMSFGLIFETPIIIVFMGLLGIVDSAFLKKGRRYFVVLAFVIGAILTPSPDVVNQSLMAIPLLLFYETGILMLRVIEKKRERESNLKDTESDKPDD